MAVKLLKVPGLGDVRFYKRRGNRSIRLSVNAQGEVRVTMPYWVPYQAAVSFAQNQLKWVQKQQQRNQIVSLRHGQPIGKQHRLQFVATHAPGRLQTRVRDQAAIISYPVDQITMPELQTAAQAVAQRALKRECQDILVPRLAQFAAQGNFEYDSVKFRRLTGRWGSCNERKIITLNVFLLELPWSLIDYVLWHELVHTQYLHHGTHFWAKLEEVCPDARQRRKAIHQYKPGFQPVLQTI